MIVISSLPFEEKLQDTYFQKVLNENIEYLEKHGKGPYEYQGSFAQRVTPWLDAGYWQGYNKWLKQEFNITNVYRFSEFHFETEKEASAFILRWS